MSETDRMIYAIFFCIFVGLIVLVIWVNKTYTNNDPQDEPWPQPVGSSQH